MFFFILWLRSEMFLHLCVTRVCRSIIVILDDFSRIVSRRTALAVFVYSAPLALYSTRRFADYCARQDKTVLGTGCRSRFKIRFTTVPSTDCFCFALCCCLCCCWCVLEKISVCSGLDSACHLVYVNFIRRYKLPFHGQRLFHARVVDFEGGRRLVGRCPWTGVSGQWWATKHSSWCEYHEIDQSAGKYWDVLTALPPTDDLVA